MRSYRIFKDDNGTSVRLTQVEAPSPDSGEIIVAVKAAGLNRGELLGRHQAYSTPAVGRPLGREAAGTVVEIGNGVAGLKIGDRVMGPCEGAFSDKVKMTASQAIPIPQNISWEEAAVIPITFLVAYDMLCVEGQARRGDWLLIHGVSSGVGVASFLLGRSLGLNVIGLSRSNDKITRLKNLGLTIGILADDPERAAKIMDATDNLGANIIVNAIGGSVHQECQELLAFEGRIAVVGYLDGIFEAKLDLARLHRGRQVIFGVSNANRTVAQRAPLIAGFKQDVMPLFESGNLAPYIDSRFRFEEFSTAKEYMEKNNHLGKVVLTIDG